MNTDFKSKNLINEDDPKSAHMLENEDNLKNIDYFKLRMASKSKTTSKMPQSGLGSI